MLENGARIWRANRELKEIEETKMQLQMKALEKKRVLSEILDQLELVRSELDAHYAVKCEAYPESQRFFSRGKDIAKNMRSVSVENREIRSKLGYVRSDLSTSKETETALFTRLQRLNTEIKRLDEDFAALDISDLVSEVSYASDEIKVENAAEIFSSLEQTKQNLSFDNATLEVRIESSDDLWVSDLPEVQMAKAEKLHAITLLESELSAVREEIEELGRRLDRHVWSVLKSEAKAENYGGDIEQAEGFVKEHRRRMRTDTRSLSEMKNKVKCLSEFIEEKHTVISGMRDSRSYKRGSYHSAIVIGSSWISAFTPTLKRSPRFPQKENALEDKIHILSLVNQTLDNLWNRVTHEERVWKSKLKEPFSGLLQDWDLILGKLAEKGDDLTVWKQLFLRGIES
jgi:chromosome segregation ATPase